MKNRSSLSRATRLLSPAPFSSASFGRTLVASSSPYLSTSEQAACSVIHNGDGLAKIIPTSALLQDKEEMDAPADGTSHSIRFDDQHYKVVYSWELTMKQLEGEYTYRPALRLNDNEKTGWTYNHLTQAIEKVEITPDQSSYTHTKETSMTLISSGLHTTLFTGFSGRMPMGIVCDRHDCEITAMLGEANTFSNRWTSENINDVIQYKTNIATCSFTQFDSFQRHVDRPDNTQTNEILAKVNRKSLRAILVDETDMEESEVKSSIAQARERKTQMQDRLGVRLPIVYYHSRNKALRVYTQDEEDLASLKKQLEEKMASPRTSTALPALSLFAPEDIGYSFEVKGFIKGNVDKQSAEKIIRMIRDGEKDGVPAHQLKEKIKLHYGNDRLSAQRFVV